LDAGRLRMRKVSVLPASKNLYNSGHVPADKIMRLHARTAVIENGFLWLPDEAHWIADY
jgi:hypothetical protein